MSPLFVFSFSRFQKCFLLLIFSKILWVSCVMSKQKNRLHIVYQLSYQLCCFHLTFKMMYLLVLQIVTFINLFDIDFNIFK